MIRITDNLRRIIAPAGGQGGVTMSYLCPNCSSFPLEDYIWWVWVKREQQVVVRDLWRKNDWRTPDRLLEVFKTHAVPHQGLCGNLINALKLLATKQEDGDGLILNIVTNLGKGSREGSHGGLRNFTQVDNHRALEVGHLREGVGSFKVTKAERRSRVPRCACQGRRRRINARSR